MKKFFLHCNAVSLDCLQPQKTTFHCCGVVRTTSLLNVCCPNFNNTRHGMLWCTGDQPSKIELGVEADENANVYDNEKINNPAVPYVGEIPGGLYLGRTIQLKGKTHTNAKRFAINLVTGEKDGSNIFFHFNPRFDRHSVVRNQRCNGSWGEEEIATSSPFPFEAGRGFRLMIFVADGKLLVSVNYRHFCSFVMRSPLEHVRNLEIEGDISLSLIKYDDILTYPIIQPSRLPRLILPKWYTDKPVTVRRKTKSIEPGTSVQIFGRVKLLPQRFFINLQSGAASVPHPLIPLHINLRLCQPGLLEQQMIYNSWIGGSWGTEVKREKCPFSPGLNFKLVILYYEEGFHISVNENFLITFPMRLPYPPVLDTVVVEGDVIVTKVNICSIKDKTVKDNK